MEQEEREKLAQDIGFWMVDQTKHLIEAMPCLCREAFILDKYPVEEVICNRCLKLKELK